MGGLTPDGPLPSRAVRRGAVAALALALPVAVSVAVLLPATGLALAR